MPSHARRFELFSDDRQRVMPGCTDSGFDRIPIALASIARRVPKQRGAAPC